MERPVNHWQPWSLRELTSDLMVARTEPGEAIRRARDRIERTERDVRAWVTVDDSAEAQVVGALGGVPMGVKDIIDLAGLPTRCGSELRADVASAKQDATIVSAWKAAGAIPLGKTVTTEFAFFAPGPTRNPANVDHTPGGSSSGSAAAVAAGHVPLAIGSQTAGSVTRPAAYCGVASLVMCHGRFPVDGVVGLSPSLDAHGVYAATVDDLAVAWSALTGEPDVGRTVANDGRALRIALWRAAPLDVVTEEMESALSSVGERLASLGAVVDFLPLESLIAEVTAVHPVVMAYEAAIERANELAHADRVSEPLANLLRSGSDTSEQEYEAARWVVSEARAEIDRCLAEFDIILGPGAPGAAPYGYGATGDPVLSRPWQALGLAAVTVPGMRSRAGLPLGLQVIATSELAALRAGVWVERQLRH